MIEGWSIGINGKKHTKNMPFEKILKFLIGLFLFLLPWQTIWIFREVFVGGVKREYLTLGFYATEVLLWIVIMMFIAWYWKNYKLQITNYKFRMTKDRVFVLSVLSLISYLLLSLIWSSDKSLVLQQSLHILEAFLLFFILWLGPLKKEEAIKWLVLGSILPCVLGIWQFLAQSTFASTWLGLALHPTWQGGTSVVASETIGRWLRAYGPFSHPNVFGGYLAIVLLLYCSIVKEEKRWLQLITYNLLLTTLFFTFSRSAWIVVFIGLLVYWFTVKNEKKWLQLTTYNLLLTIFLATLFFPLVQTRLTGNSISESHSITDRVSGYSDAWKLFKQHPVLGVGAGNYAIALWHSDKWRSVWEIQPAHNAAVLFVVEGGVIGVALFVFVLISFVKLIIQTTKHKFYYGLCYLGFVFLALFDHYLYSSYIGLMLSSLFFALISRRNGENTVSPQLIHRESFDIPFAACHNTPTRLR